MTLLAEGILKLHCGSIGARQLGTHRQGDAPGGGPGQAARRLRAAGDFAAAQGARIARSPPPAEERQRYGVAHALGHLALHHLRPACSTVLFVSDHYHVDVEQRIDSEANDFALRLLIPEQVLRFGLDSAQACSLDELAHLFEWRPS